MILITGSNSYLGRRLVKRLLAEGRKIRCLDLEKPKEQNPGIEYITSDLLEEKILRNACAGVEAVFHLLDIKSTRHCKRKIMKKINIKGTGSLLEAAQTSGVKKFFFLSSYEVYGRTKKIPTRQDDVKKPVVRYGKDKLKAEKICWEYVKKGAMATTIFRPALVVGPGISHPVVLIALLMALGMGDDNRLYIAGDGDTKFQLLHPDDAIEAFVLAYRSDAAMGKVYNLGSDKVPTIMEQVVKIKELAELDCQVKRLSPFMTRFLSRILRPFKINYLTKEHVFYLLNSLLMDCQRAKEDLKWEPKKSNIDIILETIRWYENEKL